MPNIINNDKIDITQNISGKYNYLMKKFYLFSILLCLYTIAFAQSPIVAIDRANIAGPTSTGTTSSISAIGLTRGAGVNTSNGSDFSARAWNAASQIAAQNNNEYFQWSVTADPNNNIDITELNVRLLRNNNGPSSWQIFYSLDGFTTAGIPLSSDQTANISETNYNFSGLIINSGDAGTITFRLYAWNANNNGGSFTIAGDPSWVGFGIADPGIRLVGKVNTAALNSNESTIAITNFTPTSNINYTLYDDATSLLTTSNAVKVGEFIIQDGGADLDDTDLLPTILTDLEFSVSNSDNLAAMAIFDGTVNIGETSNVGSTTSLNNINLGSGLICPDNGTKIFDIYVTFNSIVTDNEQIVLTISSASANGIAGSAFADPDAGGAQTPNTDDANRIEVLATKLVFDVQPSTLEVFEVMTPGPTLITVDSNENIDLDYSNSIILSSTVTTFDPSATIAINATNGVALFDNIIFSTTGVNESLLAVSVDGLFPAFSTLFDVLNPLVILAVQDFDGSLPEWTYTTDVPFFDNGWGTDGYYGIIDISNAAPLDYASFSNNILGENDLNDEGNGTNGFATTTFATIDISSLKNISVSFDWDIEGYDQNNDDAQYQVIFDGVGQGFIDLISNAVSSDEGTVIINIPDTVNTISLQIRIRNNGDTGFSGFDNFLISQRFVGLIYNNSVWTPNAPSGASGDQDALVRNGTYSVNTDVALDNFIVAENSNVIIEKGRSITLNSDFLLKGELVMESDSDEYSSLIVNGTFNGNNPTYSRHVNTTASSGGNDLISAPFTGQTFGEFAALNPNIFSNPANPTEKLFGPFEKVGNTYLTWDTAIPAESNEILAPAVGYRAASTDNLNFNFKGSINMGPVDIPVLNTGPNNPEWNLIGNPYPSYLKLSDFLSANGALFEPSRYGIYGYDGDASDGWEIWNQAYSDANPDASITPGQGFLFATIAGGGTVSFTPSMRTIGNTDDFIPGEAFSNREVNSIVQLKLQLNTSNELYHTNFYITDNASLGLDIGYDAAIFGNNAPVFSIYSHLVEDNNGLDMAIQSIAFRDLANEVIIPLGVNVTQGQQATISIADIDFPSDIEVYLEDNADNTFTLLTNSNYTFTANSNLSGTGRFFLRLTRNSLSSNSIDEFNSSLNIYTTKTPSTLFIKGQLPDDTEVNIIDLQGRLVLKYRLDGAKTSNQIDLSNVNTGVYIVKLTNRNYVKSQKVVIH